MVSNEKYQVEELDFWTLYFVMQCVSQKISAFWLSRCIDLPKISMVESEPKINRGFRPPKVSWNLTKFFQKIKFFIELGLLCNLYLSMAIFIALFTLKLNKVLIKRLYFFIHISIWWLKMNLNPFGDQKIENLVMDQ